MAAPLKAWPWNYTELPRFPYGEETSYRRAMHFLDRPDALIEDWGCGAAWAKQFVVQGRYRGVDGGVGHADVIADLATYRSADADGILLRHVLEHNAGWRGILANALASTRARLAIVLFTPLTDGPDEVLMTHGSIPDLRLSRPALDAALAPFHVEEEAFPSATQYGGETILYVTRP